MRRARAAAASCSCSFCLLLVLTGDLAVEREDDRWDEGGGPSPVDERRVDGGPVEGRDISSLPARRIGDVDEQESFSRALGETARLYPERK